MRIVVPLSLVALLASCSVVPPGAWTYDPTNPQPRPMLDTAQAVQVNGRIAQLAMEKNEIRSRIANERDADARLDLYAQLHHVGIELSPLERTLSAYAQAR